MIKLTWFRNATPKLALTAALLAIPLLGQDAPGTSDHGLISRYKPSRLLAQSTKNFDSYLLPLGIPISDTEFKQQLEVEGKVTRTSYIAPPTESVLAVFRTFEGQLKSAGFQVLYSCAGRACDSANRGLKFVSGHHERAFKVIHYPGGEDRYLVAKLPRAEGPVFVSLYVNTLQGGHLETYYALDVIESKPLDVSRVSVNAANMAQTIANDGRIALYGIFFDTNKADVKEESEPSLIEIGRMLKEKPALNLIVVGHTDAVGTLSANVDLSQRRAMSVVETLAVHYGIDRKRLTPLGVGFAAPVASNSTEEGRSRNRRVELVER